MDRNAMIIICNRLSVPFPDRVSCKSMLTESHMVGVRWCTEAWEYHGDTSTDRFGTVESSFGRAEETLDTFVGVPLIRTFPRYDCSSIEEDFGV